jgi:hypothetical protein
MAKKKKSIELSDKKIKFHLEKEFYSIIRYYPSTMCVDVMKYDENDTKIGIRNLPFAHLPKNIKKIIKPN